METLSSRRKTPRRSLWTLWAAGLPRRMTVPQQGGGDGGGDMLEHTAFCIHPGGPPELAHAGLLDHAAAIDARLQALSAVAPSKAPCAIKGRVSVGYAGERGSPNPKRVRQGGRAHAPAYSSPQRCSIN